MPRGKKTCPKCNAEHGPRTHKCDCGHDFFAAKNDGPAPVKSSGLTIDHKQMLSNVKSTISSVETRNRSQVSPPTSLSPPQASSAFFIRSTENLSQFQQLVPATPGRNVFTPAGECPVKPAGYKGKQWETPWTDDVVREWAEAVYAAGPYLPEAVAYFAQFFWSVNGPEYKKVRSLVLETLVAKTRLYENENESENESELEEITS